MDATLHVCVLSRVNLPKYMSKLHFPPDFGENFKANRVRLLEASEQLFAIRANLLVPRRFGLHIATNKSHPRRADSFLDPFLKWLISLRLSASLTKQRAPGRPLSMTSPAGCTEAFAALGKDSFPSYVNSLQACLPQRQRFCANPQTTKQSVT